MFKKMRKVVEKVVEQELYAIKTASKEKKMRKVVEQELYAIKIAFNNKLTSDKEVSRDDMVAYIARERTLMRILKEFDEMGV